MLKRLITTLYISFLQFDIPIGLYWLWGTRRGWWLLYGLKYAKDVQENS